MQEPTIVTITYTNGMSTDIVIDHAEAIKLGYVLSMCDDVNNVRIPSRPTR